LEQYDLIFKSAGLPYFPEIQQVIEKVTTQVQFFFDHFKGKIITITASKGKTTMTSLAYQLLVNAGYPVILAGNIGKPVLNQIDFDDTERYVVIELSSFMLETLKKKNLISILGSIFPVHLDWHGTMDNYLKAKGNILKGSETNIMFSSTKEQYFPTLSEDNLVLCGKGTDYTWDSEYFYVSGEKLFPLSDIKLLGEHNIWNISAIVALSEALSIPKEVLIQTLSSFSAVRHRLELVGIFKGIEFYDDAISTSPFSTIAALDALGDKVDTLFL
jgi:UDP-N-acetylmuramoylalanine--D-glutamate ligase